MIIKVDLKKAYDRVDWTFLKEMMGFLGFGEHLVELTLDIIRGTELAVCWNGEVLPSFKPSRGLRQGSFISLHICPMHGNTKP